MTNSYLWKILNMIYFYSKCYIHLKYGDVFEKIPNPSSSILLENIYLAQISKEIRSIFQTLHLILNSLDEQLPLQGASEVID